MSIHNYLDLSTAHLTASEMREIEAMSPDGLLCGSRVIGHNYGAWVHVPVSCEQAERMLLTPREHEDADNADDAERAEVLPALHACIQRARALGALWINFDADGDIDPELPYHEW